MSAIEQAPRRIANKMSTKATAKKKPTRVSGWALKSLGKDVVGTGSWFVPRVRMLLLVGLEPCIVALLGPRVTAVPLLYTMA